MRQFDEAYTAPHHGFRDAADYYHRASALRVIDRIRVPGADPDGGGRPVRAGRRRSATRRSTGNPNITVVSRRTAATARSSSAPTRGYDGYWAEREIVQVRRRTPG